MKEEENWKKVPITHSFKDVTRVHLSESEEKSKVKGRERECKEEDGTVVKQIMRTFLGPVITFTFSLIFLKNAKKREGWGRKRNREREREERNRVSFIIICRLNCDTSESWYHKCLSKQVCVCVLRESDEQDKYLGIERERERDNHHLVSSHNPVWIHHLTISASLD